MSTARDLVRRFWPVAALLAAGWILLAGASAPGARSGVVLPVNGPIGPATSDFFVRKLREAGQNGASLVVVTIDTPGGLDTAMRDMIQAILASEVPVVAYVSPSGARAASAGTYLVVVTIDTPGGLDTAMRDMIQSILASEVPVVAYVAPSGARAASAGTYLVYASHVAAMAPATNLGAATPVQIGAPSAPSPAPASPPADKDREAAKPGKATAPASATERKAVNDAIAYIRGLAELRGRNVDWAEAAVREGASLPADEALAAGVIDIVAEDLPALLAALDGRKVKLRTQEIELRTAGLVLHEIETDWRTELLALITNPNVAYLLMLIGIYGLLLEGYNPGAVVPGVVGAICLLLALFAFQVLSVNYAGLALIALGVVLIVAESFVPSFGALGLGGVIAFVIGSVMLLDNEVPGFTIAWQLIAAMAFAGALVLLAIVSFAVRARRRPVVSGVEGLARESAEAIEDFDHQGMVRVHGELWSAVSTEPVRAGQRLRIRKVDGLVIQVEPERE